MAFSKVDICNDTLGMLGQDVTIASIDEKTKAGRLFNRVFDRTRDFVLADHVWPFAMKHRALTPDAQEVLGWAYRYGYPSDCLNAMAVCTDSGVRVAMSMVAMGEGGRRLIDGSFDFEVQHGTQATSIVTDLEDAHLIYTCRIEDTARFSPHFAHALSCRLAIVAAPVLAAEVGMRLGRQLGDNYRAAKAAAIAQAGNESLTVAEPMTPSLAARG